MVKAIHPLMAGKNTVKVVAGKNTERMTVKAIHPLMAGKKTEIMVKVVHPLVKAIHPLMAGKNTEIMAKVVHPSMAGENTERTMLCHISAHWAE